MALNPGLSQASFDLIAERFCYLLKKYFVLRGMRYRFQRGTVRVVKEGTKLPAANPGTSIVLNGVNLSKQGINTDVDGKLFLRVTDETPGAGQSRWQLFKATGAGGTDEMARADVADGTTGSFVAQNSSGITGTIVVGTNTASISTDVTWLRCYVDFAVYDKQVFNDAVIEDAATRAAIQATNLAIVSAIQSAEALALQDWVNLLANYVANYIISQNAVPINKKTTVTSGAVTLQAAGVLEDLRSAMLGNTTIQYIVKNTVSVGAAAFNSGNAGLGTMATPQFYEKMLPGTIILQCQKETIGTEEFSVALRRSDDNTLITVSNRLRIKQEFKDPTLGISSMTLQRTFSKTGDGSNLHLAVASDASWATTGETKDNTSAGTLYWQIVVNGSNWNIQFYRAATYQPGDLEAQATNVATGATFQATDQSGRGLTVNGKVGSAPVTLTQGTFLLNPFKAGPPYDIITLAVTRTTTGQIQTLLAELVTAGYDWYLNSTTSGSETWSDSLLTRGSDPLYGFN